MSLNRIASFRFYEELNDFLPKEKKKKTTSYEFKINQSVKDAIEAQGVPHIEVDLILANGTSVGFEYHLKNNDLISVYPVFESFDITELTKLHPKPLRVTKFVLDVHLGKLSKFLRILGFDTYYRNDLDDDEIIKMSVRENRIILTRDIGILKNGLVTHGYWLRSQDSKEQLREVIQRFNLQAEISPFHRCTICNGLIRKVEKLHVEHLLKAKTKQFFNDFYQCANCKQVYWEGSHYESMKRFVDVIIARE